MSQAPLRSNPSPRPPVDFPSQPSRLPSSSSVNLQQQIPRPTSAHGLPSEMMGSVQMPMPQPSQRPASIHSQHSQASLHSQTSLHSLAGSTELPYALPGQTQTPPRHRLSRMAQDMAASGGVNQAAVFPTDPNYTAFSQTTSQGGPYGPPGQPQNIYRPTTNTSSSSRSRPPPPGLPPRLQQQQMHSAPRPDIVLPPRHQAAKNRAQQAAPQPSYLPKRLVMPTPLQTQVVPQQQIQGMPSYGSTSSGSSGESVPVPLGSDYLLAPVVAAQQAQQQQQSKRAKEVPISHGRNLLRKRTTVNGMPAPETQVMGDSGVGVHVVGNGVGKEYVPSSNASAAMFASKAPGGSMAKAGASSDSVDMRAGLESKMRERELQKEREREWKRELESQNLAQKEREKEKEKEKGGRKLSKRR
ncbi:hypothetical protein BXZ70DRAFT_297010 [Cristinia sonorae]|uniref:Uncharacterized protein n=1 Tax=Cristinia sonorae TaxID=1940300 RepID=A0A8K0XNX7_9AGAR|nr:hypothetical protein BXZ70DRAFT_297010 [Cristinia sonorae]